MSRTIITNSIHFYIMLNYLKKVKDMNAFKELNYEI